MTLCPDGGAGIHRLGAGGAALLHRQRQFRGPLPTGAGRQAWKGAVFGPWEACRLMEACHLLRVCHRLAACHLPAAF